MVGKKNNGERMITGGSIQDLVDGGLIEIQDQDGNLGNLENLCHSPSAFRLYFVDLDRAYVLSDYNESLDVFIGKLA